MNYDSNKPRIVPNRSDGRILSLGPHKTLHVRGAVHAPLEPRKRGDEILEDEHEYEDDGGDAYLDENNDLSDEMDDGLY